MMAKSTVTKHVNPLGSWALLLVRASCFPWRDVHPLRSPCLGGAGLSSNNGSEILAWTVWFKNRQVIQVGIVRVTPTSTGKCGS